MQWSCVRLKLHERKQINKEQKQKYEMQCKILHWNNKLVERMSYVWINQARTITTMQTLRKRANEQVNGAKERDREREWDRQRERQREMGNANNCIILISISFYSISVFVIAAQSSMIEWDRQNYYTNNQHHTRKPIIISLVSFNLIGIVIVSLTRLPYTQ